MHVCVHSNKDNGLLYNIFKEEAESHSNYDIIPPMITHPQEYMPSIPRYTSKVLSAVPSSQGTKLIGKKPHRTKINCP